jgi:undecaprenyl-diphosphatase
LRGDGSIDRLRSCAKGGWPLLAGLLAASLALVVFAGLAIDVVEHETFPLDQVVLDFLHTIASPALTRLMEAITTTASEPFLVIALLVLVVAWWRTRRADIVALIVAVMGCSALTYFAKTIFERARPSIHPALVHATSYSFPSGHATAAIAFYGTLAYILARHAAPRHRIWYYMAATAWILLVGLSRNYLEVHYPSDVLAAYALSLPWVLAVIFVYHCFAAPETGADEVIKCADALT